MTDKILSVKDLSINFGGLKAVDNVSFDIDRQEILGLLIPNGRQDHLFQHDIGGLQAYLGRDMA